MRNNKNYSLNYCVTYYKEDNFFSVNELDSIDVIIEDQPKSKIQCNFNLSKPSPNLTKILRNIRIYLVKLNIFEISPERIKDKEISQLEELCDYCYNNYTHYLDSFLKFFLLKSEQKYNVTKTTNKLLIKDSKRLGFQNLLIRNLLKNNICDIFPNTYINIPISTYEEFLNFLYTFGLPLKQFNKYLIKYKSIKIKPQLGYNRKSNLTTRFPEVIITRLENQTIKTNRYDIIKVNGSTGIIKHSRPNYYSLYNITTLSNLEYSSPLSMSLLNKLDKLSLRRKNPIRRRLLHLKSLDDY